MYLAWLEDPKSVHKVGDVWNGGTPQQSQQLLLLHLTSHLLVLTQAIYYTILHTYIGHGKKMKGLE